MSEYTFVPASEKLVMPKGEYNVYLRGFTDISNDVKPGAQQFRVNMNIKSTNASEEQINELEIGEIFSSI